MHDWLPANIAACRVVSRRLRHLPNLAGHPARRAPLSPPGRLRIVVRRWPFSLVYQPPARRTATTAVRGTACTESSLPPSCHLLAEFSATDQPGRWPGSTSEPSGCGPAPRVALKDHDPRRLWWRLPNRSLLWIHRSAARLPALLATSRRWTWLFWSVGGRASFRHFPSTARDSASRRFSVARSGMSAPSRLHDILIDGLDTCAGSQRRRVSRTTFPGR